MSRSSRSILSSYWSHCAGVKPVSKKIMTDSNSMTNEKQFLSTDFARLNEIYNSTIFTSSSQFACDIMLLFNPLMHPNRLQYHFLYLLFELAPTWWNNMILLTKQSYKHTHNFSLNYNTNIFEFFQAPIVIVSLNTRSNLVYGFWRVPILSSHF